MNKFELFLSKNAMLSQEILLKNVFYCWRDTEISKYILQSKKPYMFIGRSQKIELIMLYLFCAKAIDLIVYNQNN